MINCSIVLGKTLFEKDSITYRAEFSLMGQRQTGNLEQFSVMPAFQGTVQNKTFFTQIQTNYSYVKIGEFNAVNDLWAYVLHQYKHHNRIYPIIHSINGFARSYRIDHSSSNNLGIGLNLIPYHRNRFFQIHVTSGYLSFKFREGDAHNAWGLGSVIRALLPVSEQLLLSWELASYYSTKNPDFRGGGNMVQLDLRIGPKLFANIRHQIYYNNINIPLTQNYNSIMLFGIRYKYEYTKSILND